MTVLVNNKRDFTLIEALFCALLLCWLCDQTTAQKISFEGHVGCAVLPPGPPTGLKAHAGMFQ